MMMIFFRYFSGVFPNEAVVPAPEIIYLDVFMNPNKGFFECIKRRGVQHFLLDLGAKRYHRD